jgi:hypothetical protein
LRLAHSTSALNQYCVVHIGSFAECLSGKNMAALRREHDNSWLATNIHASRAIVGYVKATSTNNQTTIYTRKGCFYVQTERGNMSPDGEYWGRPSWHNAGPAMFEIVVWKTSANHGRSATRSFDIVATVSLWGTDSDHEWDWSSAQRGNQRRNTRPGALSSISMRASCNLATAATRLRPRPLP